MFSPVSLFPLTLLIFNRMYLFLSVLGLGCREGSPLVAVSGGYSLAMVPGLLTAVASLLAEHGLCGSGASEVAGLGCAESVAVVQT